MIARLGFNVQWQLAIFVVVSGLLLFFSRVIFVKIFKSKIWGENLATNNAALLGKKGIVKSEVSNMQRTGEVIIEGNTYWAISEGDKNIAIDSYIEVVGIQGNRLIVKIMKGEMKN